MDLIYNTGRSGKSESKESVQSGHKRELPTFFCRHLQFGTDDRALAPKVRSNLSTGSYGGVNGPAWSVEFGYWSLIAIVPCPLEDVVILLVAPVKEPVLHQFLTILCPDCCPDQSFHNPNMSWCLLVELGLLWRDCSERDAPKRHRISCISLENGALFKFPKKNFQRKSRSKEVR